MSTAKVSGVRSATVTTPASPTMNSLLRMRVINDWSAIADACHNPSYGQVEDYAVIFTNPPTLTTTAASSITDDAADAGGNITDQGASGVTERGIVWSIHTGPTLESNWGRTASGSGIGSFSAGMSDLQPNTTYYVRAYAVNTYDVGYGNEISFTTDDREPTLTTTAVTPSYTSGNGGGNITDDGGLPITARGVVWAASSGPTLGSCLGYTSDGNGSGSFSSTISGLSTNTTYYVRAYATNSYATVYGAEVTFTTLPPDPNQAKDLFFSEIGINDMRVNWTNGNRSSRIVIVNTSNSFTDPVNGTDPAANATYAGSGEQVVYNGSGNSVVVDGLTEETTYWFRVFEKNGTGGSTDFSTSAATGNPNSQQTYCEPTYSNNPVGTNFTNFTFATINNTSGATKYSDFTNISTNLTPGNTYAADFTISYNTVHVDMWIDFDDDAVFDASEKLIDDLTCASNSTTSQNVTIPGGANLGTHRMRIRANWGGNGDPCNNWNWGETEDYTVVLGADFTTVPPNEITNKGATLRGTINPRGNAVSDIKFEWGTSTSYGNIATPASTTATGTNDVDFSASVTGLERGQEYHCRIVGTVSGGEFTGEDMIFMVPPGSMLVFDGVDDHALAPDHTDYQFGSATDFSVEFWLEAVTGWSGDPSLLSSKNWASGTNAGWNVALSSTGTGIDVNVGDGTNRADLDAGTVNDSRWHHIAVVFDRDALVALYVDGRLSQSTSMASVGDIDNALDIGIGQDGTGSYGTKFRGRMDEIRIWNDVRTQQEIRENMHLSLAGTETNLVAYWPGMSSDTKLYELVNANHAEVLNGTQRNAAKIPVGHGTSNTQTVSSGGTYTFTGTGVEMVFPGTGTYPNGALTVTRVEGDPDHIPVTLASHSRCYWVVRNYGTNSTFSELSSFRVDQIGEVTENAATTPGDVKLYKRNSWSTGDTWGSIHSYATAATQNTDGNVTFAAGNGLTSFSQILVGDQGVDLPIELVHFTATPIDGKHVRLDWQTASTINHDYFTVEKTRDTQHFLEVAQIDGVPFSTELMEWQAWDYEPFQGLSFYRLTSTDLDGTAQLSELVAVNLQVQNSIVLVPNPVPENGTLQLLTTGTEPLRIDIINQLGQTVRTARVSPNGSVDLNGIVSGMYHIRIEQAGQRVHTGTLVISK